jgi:hypothetical protein
MGGHGGQRVNLGAHGHIASQGLALMRAQHIGQNLGRLALTCGKSHLTPRKGRCAGRRF